MNEKKDTLFPQIVGIALAALLVWWGSDWNSTAFLVAVCAAVFWIALAESETH